ncbi:SDR family oxidoreductase [Marinobacterium maritimum]|uniref:SDR family oxidoreductase n=1 Tax=Marinobacterium maritimum TaxID=500162 RepID=A0ABN1I2W5_9GAMM
METDGRTIVVTGAGRGLGRAISRHLADKGANLALIDLNREDLDQTRQLISQSGGIAASYICDITQEAEVEAVFKDIMADFGAIHALVNNAGITRDGLLVKTEHGKVIKRMSFDQWQQVLDVNLTGTFLCGREAATRMIDNATRGIIINISSLAWSGNVGQSNYSAAKAGIVALTSLWARELARYSIRTGAIAPGGIATDMVMAMPEEARKNLETMIPASRLGTPEEIAQAVSFIVENDYFNGRLLEIDGGLRI